jgi:hypothetical protein
MDRFCDVEIGPDQWNKYRVKYVVDELVEYLPAFVGVCLGKLITCGSLWAQPFYI